MPTVEFAKAKSPRLALTVPMVAMLRTLSAGIPQPLYGRSEFGYPAKTREALLRRGLIDDKGVTADGYGALAAWLAAHPNQK